MTLVDLRPDPGVPAPSSPISPPTDRPRDLGLPRPSRLVETDLIAVATAFAIIVVGMWWRHGGAGQLIGHGLVATLTSLAQISGLLASAVGLMGLALVARPRCVERLFGLDRLFVWHRFLGEAMGVLVAAHVGVSVAAWTTDLGFGTTVRSFTGAEPYMATAFIGAGLIGVVTISSLRTFRRRLSYETWYFLHLSAYIGFAMSFSHAIVLGGDLADDALARGFWILVHVGVLTTLIVGRWGRLITAWFSPLEVVSAEPVGSGVVSMRLGGRGLHSLPADSGQFFLLRPRKSGQWWQAHPFSLSAAPSSDGLRFTIKDRGDASSSMGSLRAGTKVVVEGPYGTTTPGVFDGKKSVFIAGGVGIAPALAIVERLGAGSNPIVLLRARDRDGLPHLAEIRALVKARGGRVITLLGPSAALADGDPFSADALLRVIPDIGRRVALVCGPERLLAAASKGLRAVGVPRSDIHYEKVWW